MKVRKKPVVIDAFVTMDSADLISDLKEFCYEHGDSFHDHFKDDGDGLKVLTAEGTSYVVNPDTDVILRGIKGEYYPCKKDIFADTYEPVENVKDFF